MIFNLIFYGDSTTNNILIRIPIKIIQKKKISILIHAT